MAGKADIWMPLYIGDYLADTSHLDAQRHGCYLLWMMHYWRKGPLTANLDELVAIGRLRGADAPSIAQALLDEFFVKNGDGRYHQKRADMERERWQAKRKKTQQKASVAATARWVKDAPSNASSNAPSITQALLEQCPLPLPLPLPSPLPIPGVSCSAKNAEHSPPDGVSPDSGQAINAFVLTPSTGSGITNQLNHRIELLWESWLKWREDMGIKRLVTDTLDTKRRQKAMARFKEALRMAGSDLDKAMDLMKWACWGTLDNPWNNGTDHPNGKKHLSWEAHVFRSADVFKSRIDFYKREIEPKTAGYQRETDWSVLSGK